MFNGGAASSGYAGLSKTVKVGEIDGLYIKIKSDKELNKINIGFTAKNNNVNISTDIITSFVSEFETEIGAWTTLYISAETLAEKYGADAEIGKIKIYTANAQLVCIDEIGVIKN